MIANKQKQKTIEDKLDSYTNEMGRDMIAIIGLHARQTVGQWKTTRFIKEFSSSLGFNHHIDTAVRILKYLYPPNKAYWTIQDKRFIKIVKQSPWLKANGITF